MDGFLLDAEDTFLNESLGISGGSQCGSCFLSYFFHHWLVEPVGVGANTATDTSVVPVLRFLLFLSVCLFLWTAILLQGTILELGMIRCRRMLQAWNRFLAFSCRRLT